MVFSLRKELAAFILFVLGTISRLFSFKSDRETRDALNFFDRGSMPRHISAMNDFRKCAIIFETSEMGKETRDTGEILIREY